MNQTLYIFHTYIGTLLPSGRVKWYGDDGTEYGTTRNAEGYEKLEIEGLTPARGCGNISPMNDTKHNTEGETMTTLTVGTRIGNEQGEIKIISIPEWDGNGNAMCEVEYVRNGSGTETMALYTLEQMIDGGHVKVL